MRGGAQVRVVRCSSGQVLLLKGEDFEWKNQALNVDELWKGGFFFSQATH